MNEIYLDAHETYSVCHFTTIIIKRRNKQAEVNKLAVAKRFADVIENRKKERKT